LFCCIDQTPKGEEVGNLLVSILIPCYNAQPWIATAIKSALAQDYPDKEVIVVDDGSTDASRSIIDGFGNQIQAESTGNRGSNAARNRLLAVSKGVWIQYLDADDYLLPGKISAQMRALSKLPDLDVLLGPSIIQRQVGRRDEITERPLPLNEDVWRLLALFCLPQVGAPLWRARALQDIGGWSEQQEVCQDDDMYLRLLIAGKKFSFSESSGAVYRHWSEDTLCRRDKRNTYRHRLRILERAESHLKSTDQLTEARLDAINLSRLICARILWQWDPEAARAAIAQIKATGRRVKSVSPTVPATYLVTYWLLGFAAAEHLAALVRSFGVSPRYRRWRADTKAGTPR
jgi:glycosyltransferase involved in cell wall biosynthesis